ncbi:MAG: hypothetical protein MMC33_003213 [Icmadophila ericetorum]|nr:hypothetical protein [Icmadophila ericetorum]
MPSNKRSASEYSSSPNLTPNPPATPHCHRRSQGPFIPNTLTLAQELQNIGAYPGTINNEDDPELDEGATELEEYIKTLPPDVDVEGLSSKSGEASSAGNAEPHVNIVGKGKAKEASTHNNGAIDIINLIDLAEKLVKRIDALETSFRNESETKTEQITMSRRCSSRFATASNGNDGVQIQARRPSNTPDWIIAMMVLGMFLVQLVPLVRCFYGGFLGVEG